MLEALALALAQPACVASVHDGDTLTLCSGEKVRLAEIDAPELRGSPSCRTAKKRSTHWCDYRLGIQSRDALRAFVKRGPVTIQREGRDYYGRTLAVVRINGRSAGWQLIGMGLARPWRK